MAMRRFISAVASLGTPARFSNCAPSAAGRAFSHTTKALENQTPNKNPSYPAFNLKHISSNPRVRFYLRLTILTLAGIETMFWFNVGPKLFGKDKNNGETGQ